MFREVIMHLIKLEHQPQLKFGNPYTFYEGQIWKGQEICVFEKCIPRELMTSTPLPELSLLVAWLPLQLFTGPSFTGSKLCHPRRWQHQFPTPVKLFGAWVTYTGINQPRPLIAGLVRTIFCLTITLCSIEHEIFKIR